MVVEDGCVVTGCDDEEDVGVTVVLDDCGTDVDEVGIVVVVEVVEVVEDVVDVLVDVEEVVGGEVVVGDVVGVGEPPFRADSTSAIREPTT